MATKSTGIRSIRIERLAAKRPGMMPGAVAEQDRVGDLQRLHPARGTGVCSADSTIAGRTIVSWRGLAAISVRSPIALRERVGVAPAERARALAAALGELVADPGVAQDLGARAGRGAAGGADGALGLLDEAVLVHRQARLGLDVAAPGARRRRARRRGPARARDGAVPDGRSSTRPVRWPAA